MHISCLCVKMKVDGFFMETFNSASGNLELVVPSAINNLYNLGQVIYSL